jgi:hypothetical protein
MLDNLLFSETYPPALPTQVTGQWPPNRSIFLAQHWLNTGSTACQKPTQIGMGPAETLRPAWPSDQPCVRTQIILANSRLIACRQDGVTFRYKDYRADGRARYKQMTLATDEFIRRFLIHVLPKGFHRIRHYGLFATPSCTDNIARARELLAVPMPQDHNADADAVNPNEPATRSRFHGPREAGATIRLPRHRFWSGRSRPGAHGG